jgi:formylglycine-generating enzyme required for sulfatase activity
MRRAILLLVALTLTVLVGMPSASAAKRVALVIGISDYHSLSKLNNPVPDAKAIAAALKSHGFEVTEHYDLPRAELLDALEAFSSVADQASVALVYYAGHGMEMAGKNVLAPKDMEIDCEKKTPRRALDLDQLFSAVSGAPQQVVLLDACRNDPFPQCPARGLGGSGGFRGFTRVSSEDHSLLIANSTLGGQLAADGAPGQHSPFATALLARFSTDASSYLRDLLEGTAGDVQKASQGAQVPEILTRGGAVRVCLDETKCGGVPATTPPPSLTPAPASDPARDAWNAAQNTGSASVLEAFIAKFGDSFYASLATARLAELKKKEEEEKKVAVVTSPAPVAPSKPVEPAVITVPKPQVSSRYKPGDTFKDCDKCPEMVVVPAGEFVMGSPPDAELHRDDEAPSHRVDIATPFALGKFEVTRDQFEAFAKDSGFQVVAKGMNISPCFTWETTLGLRDRSFRNPGYKQSGREPAACIGEREVTAYLSWLSQKAGKTYRLPSEAEWEYAARAGDRTLTLVKEGNQCTHSNGADRTLKKIFGSEAEHAANCSDGYAHTSPVGSFPANAFGLQDMQGNLWEWTADCWHENYVGAPTDGSAWKQGGDCSAHPARGGSWYERTEFFGPARRSKLQFSAQSSLLGLRVARNLEPGD